LRRKTKIGVCAPNPSSALNRLTDSGRLAPQA
jgi:hypothetical protein